MGIPVYSAHSILSLPYSFFVVNRPYCSNRTPYVRTVALYPHSNFEGVGFRR